MGINFTYLLITILNIALIILWLVLFIVALLKMRKMNLTEWERIAWALVIICIPILGASAFLIVHPKEIQ